MQLGGIITDTGYFHALFICRTMKSNASEFVYNQGNNEGWDHGTNVLMEVNKEAFPNGL